MRSQVVINIEQLKSNYQIYNSFLPPCCKPMVVVKANGYGHGDVEVARALSQIGVNNYAVSNIDEAIRLRKAGIQGQILVLGFTDVDRANELLLFDITQALLSEEYAQVLSEKEPLVKCHFAIDTGMRRIGLNADNPSECERIIRHYSSKLKLTGLFTHLCVADSCEVDSKIFTRGQIIKFQNIANKVEDINLPYIHYMNSAGGLWYHEGRSNLARLGIILYGLKPDYHNTLPDGIRPILTWKSVVSMVKKVYPGDSIGYGRTFEVNRPMTIATVSTGYADGYSRLLSNNGHVLLKGKRAPIVGRICMDQFMIDVTDIDGVFMGSEVVLIGNSGSEVITADDLAQLTGTIGYEIVCAISDRVERVYI